MFNSCEHFSWIGKSKLKICFIYTTNMAKNPYGGQAMLNVLISLFAGVDKKI